MYRPLVLAHRRGRLLDLHGLRGLGLFGDFYGLRREICDLLDRVGCNQVGCIHWLGLSSCPPRLLAPRDRNLGVLVLMLGVTGGAACLLHLVVDHRDDRMIGDTALARTVIV
jgi:hypothetical protein